VTALFRPNAPRFHALWERLERRRIFVVPKAEWSGADDLPVDKKVPLELNEIELLPFARVALQPYFRGALAQRTSDRIEVTVWRYDPKDGATPYNVDCYQILPSLPDHLDIEKMVETGSTSLGINFDLYRHGHLFLLREDPGTGPWTSDLPPELAISLRRST
jgi:hypothetical protein